MRWRLVVAVALAGFALAGFALAPAGVAGQSGASVSDPTPTSGDGRVVENAPVELSVDVATSAAVTVEFRDELGRTIGSQSLSSDGTATVTWDASVGSHQWRAVVRDGNGNVLDATSEQGLTVTERDPDSTCLEFETEIADRNFFCAAASPFLGVMPLPVLGMIVWGGLSMGVFIRTGSPILPYVLLLLTGGAISGVLAGPALALATVGTLAVVGGVPLLLYIQYAR